MADAATRSLNAEVERLRRTLHAKIAIDSPRATLERARRRLRADRN
jgi:hypothetical protein